MPDDTSHDSMRAATVRRIEAEAGGVLDVHLAGPGDGPRLLFAVMHGDWLAEAFLKSIVEQLAKIHEAPAGERPLCVSCPAELAAPAGVRFALVAASRRDPSTALGFGLCPACGNAGDIDEKVAAGLRRIWPQARSIRVTHPEGGRA